ncbi:RNase III inhibitor [Acetobacterium wieringae]|uniref:RNase III inhibitor n=1 Tax=Acetobacterium wieringae TaxID=52694 RepID=A0A5D0WTK4_9FIRM|nr:macro domain-containing protein [Acetobacterium wieringae]TYC87620.1 RNase III inhibitor [Acetobacterium wieringae]
MPFEIIRNDITKMTVDVIVNAANTGLKMGGGVCGAIFAAAGADKLQAECDEIGVCPVGEAVITGAYQLPAKCIIHTVGPVWQGGDADEARLLHRAYTSSLQLAMKHHCKSIAFPLISSGIYGYPKDQVLKIAVAAITEFLMENEMFIYLVVFDKKAFAFSEKLFADIEKYIDDHYADEQPIYERNMEFEPELLKYSRIRMTAPGEKLAETRPLIPAPVGSIKRSLADVIGNLDGSFSEMLLRLIDEKGMTDVETYKKANIDRKLFSKIRSKKDYNPSKATAIAFAIALELNLDETHDLLGRAGYTLSHSHIFDLIIEYFISAENYNIYEINEALFAFDQTLLGA